MISPTVMSRVIALVRQVTVEPRRSWVTGDALLSDKLGIGMVDRARIAASVDGEFATELPQHAVDDWLTVADIARSVERYARAA